MRSHFSYCWAFCNWLFVAVGGFGGNGVPVDYLLWASRDESESELSSEKAFLIGFRNWFLDDIYSALKAKYICFHLQKKKAHVVAIAVPCYPTIPTYFTSSKIIIRKY